MPDPKSINLKKECKGGKCPTPVKRLVSWQGKSKRKPVRAQPCDENHPNWNPDTGDCKKKRPEPVEKEKVAVKMRTIRYDDPVRGEEDWEEEHSGLTHDERVKKTQEYRKRKGY